MFKIKKEQLFFSAYLLVAFYPRLGSIDVINVQFLFLSIVGLTHFFYNVFKDFHKTEYNIVVFLFFLIFCFFVLVGTTVCSSGISSPYLLEYSAF